MWPVILRELRAGSRRWTTYWLRLLAAFAVVMGVLWWFGHARSSARAGSEVFAWMHRIILAAIWVLVPLMTCDCLSQEKREGTLGLLFLTNLSAREIVFAKAVAHALRAFTLWLATVPIIGIPILLGGLVWKEIVLSCSFAFASICGALAVGLFASALGRRLNSSVAWSTVLGSISMLLFAPAVLAFLIACALVPRAVQWPELFRTHLIDWFELATAFFWNSHDIWTDSFSNKASGAILTGSVLLVPLAALLLLLFCTLVIAPIVRRNWQDQPKTKRQTETEKFFCSPVFMTGLFRRWMRRSLERNPIGWLEKRSWTGRITAWIWLALMISLSSMLTYTSAERDDFDGFNYVMWMLLGTIAYVAAGSFRRERETGALELILVTPLSERHIIFGRLRGLWSQFLPTFLLWVAVVVYLSSALHDWQVANVLRFTVAYFIVPVVGLYFSLRSRLVLLSWLATLAVAFALPQLPLPLVHWCADLFGIWPDPPFYAPPSERNVLAQTFPNIRNLLAGLSHHQILIALPIQLLVAAFLLWRLRVNLVRRSFSLR